MNDGPADHEPKKTGYLYGAAKTAARLDATTEAAKDIMERERADRDAKTARLKAARLARDATTIDNEENSD